MENLLKLKQQWVKAEKKARELKEKIDNLCTHPEEYQEVLKKYHSGGYDYNSYTTYITHCKICGRNTYRDEDHGF